MQRVALRRVREQVGKLHPINREVDVGAVAGGVIPDFEEVNGHFKTKEVDRPFEYGIVLS